MDTIDRIFAPFSHFFDTLSRGFAWVGDRIMVKSMQLALESNRRELAKMSPDDVDYWDVEQTMIRQRRWLSRKLQQLDG